MKKKPGPKKRNLKRLHVLVSPNIYSDIEKFCANNYINKTTLIILAVQKYMDEMERKK